MDSYILPRSFLTSSQQTIPTAEPLSATFLQYQLSRTPTPKRFSRNVNRTSRQHQEPATARNQDSFRSTKTDFRQASEVIAHDAAAEAISLPPRGAKRWPLPKHVMATWAIETDASGQEPAQPVPGRHSEEHASSASLSAQKQAAISEDEDDLTLNDAIREAAVIRQAEKARKDSRPDVSSLHVLEDNPSLSRFGASADHPPASPKEQTALKRPKKRHPLHSAPPVGQRRAALTEIQNTRQYSIPDDERPAEAKKRKRPRAPRNLPSDELEVAQERFVLPHDAPPMSDSDEGDNDPVEELSDDRERHQRRSKQANDKRNARLKEKTLPNRPAQKRQLTFSGFKVIEPLIQPARADEKKIWQHPVVGDGFESSERLPIGGTARSARPRRRTRPQVPRPTMYYKALEIVESKPSSVTLGEPERSALTEHTACDSDLPNDETQPAISVHPASEVLVPQVDFTLLALTTQHDLAEIEELDLVDMGEGARLLHDELVLEIEAAKASSIYTVSHGHGHSLDAAEVDKGSVAMPEEVDIDTEADDMSIARQESPQDEAPLEEIQAHILPKAEDHQQLDDEDDQNQNLPVPPQHELHENGGKKEPPNNKIKRRVTLSDEVKIQTDVEPEPEEEYESESEAQSQAESDRKSDRSRSTDSDKEQSPEEGDDLNGSDDDADDEGDEDERGGYPTAKLDNRAGSPELVSSGYYAGSSSPARAHFGFDDRMALRPSAEEDNEDGRRDMMLDMDDEIEELPTLPHLISHRQFDYVEEIADSDDEMLIMSPRATSAEKAAQPEDEDLVDTDYGEGVVSDENLASYSMSSRTGYMWAGIPFISESNVGQQLFGRGRSYKESHRNLADSAVAMTPPTSHAASNASEHSHGGQSGPVSQPLPRKIKRAKTSAGVQQSDPPVKQISVRDVPTYFTRASQTLSSPLSDVKLMMRRARTLPSAQYVSESGDENGFIVSDESFKERLKGRKNALVPIRQR